MYKDGMYMLIMSMYTMYNWYILIKVQVKAASQILFFLSLARLSSPVLGIEQELPTTRQVLYHRITAPALSLDLL